MEDILKNREWREFFINDVADIVSGMDIYETERLKGNTPYVTATALRNGIGYFVSNNNLTLEENCLSVNRNGSVGYSFYHPYKALYSNDCRKLRLKCSSKYVGLFISTQITAQKGKYGYGYKMGTGRLKRQKIMLPVNGQKEPDYAFMEEYMRGLERRKIAKYQEFITKTLEKQLITNNLQNKEWGEFFIGNLFVLTQGKSKGLNHLDMESKGISYLGATNNNNGVLTFVKREKNLIHKGNGIAFIRNGEGSMGYSIYKAEDFIATSDLSIGYNEKLNKYNGMFITTVADKVRGKYNFGYKRSGGRLEKETILLPINSIGEPDYEYMEQYMRNKERESLLRYLEYLKINIQFKTL